MQALEPMKGIPALSWRLAQRVCDPVASSDVIIQVTGPKGSGKSTLSLQLCEDIAANIAKIRGNGAKPSDFFDISHVVSIDRDGALTLLSSGILKKKNQVFLLDDVSTMWSNRKSMTFQNQALNDISMICRVYESVLVMNTVTRGGVDLVARQLTDVLIRMISKSTITKQSWFKAYLVETSASGKELHKYFTWVNPFGKKIRITMWIGGVPSKGLNDAYKAMRIQETDKHIQAAADQLLERNGIKKETQSPVKQSVHENILNNYKKVGEMYSNHARLTDIETETGLSRYWITKNIAYYKQNPCGDAP